MKKFLLQFSVVYFAIFSAAYAKESQQFPNISGNILFQFEADRVLSTNASGVSPNNAYIYIEPNMSLNFNKNWSMKTDWRLNPNDSLTTRNSTYPERYRTIFQSGRGFNPQDEGLLIEELKLNFENEDLRVYAGKFDPTFGTAYRKEKRIGVFTAQFAEDYNLREKIGVGGSAFLENSKITVNSFFNDTTGLSRSAINDRGRASSNDGIAGNTGTISSYSVSMDGDNFFGVENWFYNVGYRSLGVASVNDSKREKGYVFGSEYSYKLGYQTSIIPFVEIVKIDNFTGEQGRNANYETIALIGKYSSWTSSVSYLSRNIKQSQRTYNINDHQLQLSVGYKITNNLTIDLSRSTVKENGNSGSLVGAMMSYLYHF